MKKILFISFIAMLTAFTAVPPQTIHSFKVKSLDGGTIDFAKFKKSFENFLQ